MFSWEEISYTPNTVTTTAATTGDISADLNIPYDQWRREIYNPITIDNQTWHAVSNFDYPAPRVSVLEGKSWVDMCKQLLELFKEHFEHGDLDISEDEFWRIWNGEL